MGAYLDLSDLFNESKFTFWSHRDFGLYCISSWTCLTPPVTNFRIRLTSIVKEIGFDWFFISSRHHLAVTESLNILFDRAVDSRAQVPAFPLPCRLYEKALFKCTLSAQKHFPRVDSLHRVTQMQGCRRHIVHCALVRRK